jgi:serine/threonine protein kinase
MIKVMSNVEQFGKYILLEKIAAGGMAEVYLAKSSGANGVSKFVAVKRILPQYSDNQEFIEMFKDEANVAINLNHSNVVTIYDFGIERGQFYLVMEFVEGRNLRQILNELKKINKSVSISQAVYIIKEAAAGLDHAHRCTDSKSGKPLNITHRDMSPQNIMISFEGDSKVIDFGIAKAEKESEATKAGTLKGKFAYMSPEQSEGLPIDPRTDVFALGIILWELLANDRLFTGSNEAAILRKVRDCQIPPIRKINPLVPTELERIVTKALAKDKNVRYQTAANLQKDLNRFLNTQYPDFSSHDFSAFIKECFKDAFTEGREKLVQYSKIERSNNLSSDLTATEPAVTLTTDMLMAPPLNIPLPNLPQHENETPKGFSGLTEIKISLDGVRKAGAGMNANSPKRSNQHGSGFQNEYGQSTRLTHLTKMSKTNLANSSKSVKHDSSDVFMKFILVVALGLGSLWGYKSYIKPKPQITNQKLINTDAEDSGEIVSASTAKVTVSFTSQPVTGAQIYIDGRDTGQITPSIIAVIANKDLDISMVKPGYAKYETTKQFHQTSSFSATLEPQISGGYVNIYVINGGARPTVFVNGQRLSENLPIKKYRVQPNTVVTIYAENAITRLHDEVKVKVAADQVQDVELILGRTHEVEKK